MSNATDYLGNPLNDGDEVIFVRLKYRELARGIVLRITNQMLVIDDGSSDGVRQYHNQVVKVPK